MACRRMRFCLLPAGLALLALTGAGCSQQKIFPVHGQLVDTEGRPITELNGGTVIFENKDAKSSAVGVIEPDGSFWMTTLTPRDGAYPGQTQVCIGRPSISPTQRAPHVIHPRYDSLETSGLEVTIESKHNEVKVTVDRYAGRPAAPAWEPKLTPAEPTP